MSSQIEINKKIISYLQNNAYRSDKIIKDFIDETKELGSVSKMQISPEQGKFLEIITSISNAKQCLEIGRFTGMSALCIARGLKKGKLYSVDNSNEFTLLAKKYWEKAEVSHKIESLVGEGIEIMQSFIDRKFSFDLIFIDADKANYNNYFELSLLLVPEGGIIILDNMLWSGKVADENIIDKQTSAIRNLNEKILKDSRIDFSLLPIADGLSIIQKK